MSHVVLLGDSIFDNAAYVPGEPPVIAQVQKALPPGWKATLAAVDGDVSRDVPPQLRRVPGSATHLFLSVGGNDALGAQGLLYEPAHSVAEALSHLVEAQRQFREEYEPMLRAVLALGRPTAVCTIYDAVPNLSSQARVALGTFNEVILRTAFKNRLPVIDLRLLCADAADYSARSPIEPSAVGGAKIARVIARVATGHDYSTGLSTIYS